MSDDSHPTMTYPTKDQHSRWKQEAEDMDMCMSEFVECMVEAGMKKFDVDVDPDESTQELRRHRNDLRRQLGSARDRIDRLEDELYHGERGAIQEYIHENPGATYDEIIQHVIDTVPTRVTRLLDELEGEEIRVEDGVYYPVKGEST